MSGRAKNAARRAYSRVSSRVVMPGLERPLAAFVFSFIGSYFFFFLMSISQAHLATDCTVTAGVCGTGCACTTSDAPDGTYKDYVGSNLVLLGLLAFSLRASSHIFMAQWSSTTLDPYYEIAMALKNWLVGDHMFYLRTFLACLAGLFLGPLASAATEVGWHDSVTDSGVAQISHLAAGKNFYKVYISIVFVVMLRAIFVLWSRVSYAEQWDTSLTRQQAVAATTTDWPWFSRNHMLHGLLLGAVDMMLAIVFGPFVGLAGWPTHAFWVGVFAQFKSTPTTPDGVTSMDNDTAYWVAFTALPVVVFSAPFLMWFFRWLIAMDPNIKHV